MLSDRYLKTVASKIIAYVKQHVIFQLYKTYLVGGAWKNRQMTTKSINKPEGLFINQTISVSKIKEETNVSCVVATRTSLIKDVLYKFVKVHTSAAVYLVAV